MTYTTIKAALAKADEGDTIWVQDGYVCDSDATTRFGGCANRVCLNKAVTLRSESGYVDEKNGKGATIRGAYHSEEQSCGNNAIRCVGIKSGATLFGFILEDGATSKYTHQDYPGGGGIYGDGTVSNCVIRNTRGSTGGAVRVSAQSTLSLENCVITNNAAYYCGGGVQGHAILRRCDISYNTSLPPKYSAYNGGGVYGDTGDYRAELYSCRVTHNDADHNGQMAQGGGIMNAIAYDTDIMYNNVEGSGGGAGSSVLTNCRVLWNYVESSSSSACLGGGIYKCTATNCVVMGNSVVKTVSGIGSGGGSYNSNLVGCEICCNTCDVQGAGINLDVGYTCRNCTITNNCSLTGTGGVHGGGTLSNCLIAWNRGSNPTGMGLWSAGVSGIKTWSGAEGARIVLENCTVVSNVTVYGSSGWTPYGGVWHANLINTISYDNGYCKNGQQDGDITVATNSCCSILTDAAKYPGCTAENPLFDKTREFQVSVGSPCRNSALAFDWMTDKSDVRSKDVLGNPRLAGPAPDMGCFERVVRGLMIEIR